MCDSVPKNKVVELCDKAMLCAYEREILLEHYCAPRKKILSLELSSQGNFYVRDKLLEEKVKFFLADSPNFFSADIATLSLLTKIFG